MADAEKIPDALPEGENNNAETVLKDPPKDPPKLLSYILSQAISMGASTIHFEPTEQVLRVRFRVMGALFEQSPIDASIRRDFELLLRRSAHMVEDDLVHPQEGPFRYTIEGGKQITGHVSLLPTIHGAKQVLSLSSGDGFMTLKQIGMSEKEIDLVREILDEPGSMLIVAGPWGTGKSATLYALAEDCSNEAMSVATLEDPVEIMLPGVTQTQISPRDGLTFLTGMRAILRQDPNVVVLGELNNGSEADIAMVACLQGQHRIISCLQTRTGVETIMWLLNAGLDPVKIAESLSGVIIQRLVRRVCKKCAKPAKLHAGTIEALGLPIDPDGGWVRGYGCVACNGAGYKGKTAIFEIIPIREEVKEVIRQNPSKLLLDKALRKLKIRTLRQAGLLRAKAGITTVTELLRVT